MVALSRNLPRKQAMEMLLTGDVFSADDALRFGLVNAIAEQDAVAEATALADKIAGKSNAAIAYGKRAFYQQTTMNLPDAYAHASAVMVENMLKAQAREGVEAFLQKRAELERMKMANRFAYEDAASRHILTSVGTIALVGASNNPSRPANDVRNFLQAHGFRVIPVNPGLAGQQLGGEQVYARLADIVDPIDMVDIFRRSDAVAAIVDEILTLANRPKVVWTTIGRVRRQAAAKAQAAGLNDGDGSLPENRISPADRAIGAPDPMRRRRDVAKTAVTNATPGR